MLLNSVIAALNSSLRSSEAYTQISIILDVEEIGLNFRCGRAVKLLLEKGADMTVANNDGWTPLKSASSGGHLKVVKLLLKEGASLLLQTTDGPHYFMPPGMDMFTLPESCSHMIHLRSTLFTGMVQPLFLLLRGMDMIRLWSCCSTLMVSISCPRMDLAEFHSGGPNAVEIHGYQSYSYSMQKSKERL